MRRCAREKLHAISVCIPSSSSRTQHNRDDAETNDKSLFCRFVCHKNGILFYIPFSAWSRFVEVCASNNTKLGVFSLG